MTNQLLLSIAEKYHVSIPQVVIQWANRRGVMVLPASKSPSHQQSNLLKSHDFTLTEEEMISIDSLDGKPPQHLRKERDISEVDIQFTNQADGSVHVFWVDSSDEHVHVGNMDEKGSTLQLTTYHGHSFVFKKSGADEGTLLHRHTVNKSLGPKQRHDIKDRGEEL
jgi:hypothetical protein